jgi:hypothetical protein
MAVATRTCALFIDGAWVESRAAAHAENRNPARTGEPREIP